MKDYYPQLMRGLGSLIILFVTVLTLKIAHDAADVAQSITRAKITFDTSTPFAELNEQQKKERPYHVIINSMSETLEELNHDLRKRNIVGTVTNSPTLSILSLIGSILVSFSFFVEVFTKKKKSA
jgi:hypothetical protein